MPDVYTYTDTNSSTALSTGLLLTAYDKALEFKLRSMPLFRRFADKKPVDLTTQGSVVDFKLYNRIASPATTPIDEIVSPDLVQIPKADNVTVTMYEYGRGVALTKKLRHDSYVDVDPGVAQILTDDLVDTIDTLARTALNAGTQKVTSANKVPEGLGLGSAAATNTLTDATTDYFSSTIARFVPTKMREANVSPWTGEMFAAVIHPDIAYDLRSESDAAGWRAPHTYQAASEIWTGTVGAYEGAGYIETPRAYTATDGASSQKVYRSLFLGRQALAEAVAEEPHATVSDHAIDHHNRNYVIGWYGYMGFGLYRQESVVRVETVSSLS